MNVLLIVAHPSQESFNHAIARTCATALTANRHEVVSHDLYREGFEPLLPQGEFPRDAALPPVIVRHCEELARGVAGRSQDDDRETVPEAFHASRATRRTILRRAPTMEKIVTEADLALLVKAGLSEADIRHSILVAKKAVEIAERTGVDLDMRLVARGALFHDLGKALTHSFQHGELGAEIGKSLGLPKAITDIARKHFHGGLTPQEARALDLPEIDYTPRLLEERIILYADRLVDILTEGFFTFADEREAEARFEEIVTTHRAYGKDQLTSARYVAYHQEIAALIGQAKARQK